MRRPRITAKEHDAIIEALRPMVREIMRRFNISASTVAELAFFAGRRS